MSDLREFTLFPRIPPELRLRIWNFAFTAIQTPRIVQLIGVEQTPDLKKIIRTRTIPSIPLLAVCKESRYEILKQEGKEKIFGFQPVQAKVLDNGTRGGLEVPGVQFDGVPFNPEIDILMVDMYTAEVLAEHAGNDLLELRYVAVYDAKVQFSSWDHFDICNNEGYDFDSLCALYKRLVADQEFSKLQWMNWILEDEIPGVELPPGYCITYIRNHDHSYQMNNCLFLDILENVGYFKIRNSDNKVSPSIGSEPDAIYEQLMELWSPSNGTREMPGLGYFSELLEMVKVHAVGYNNPRLALPQRDPKPPHLPKES